MVLLVISIGVGLIGIILLIAGYSSSSQNDRDISSAEKIIDTQKKDWAEDFSDHLKKLFAVPCPTCTKQTILAEGVTKEVRINESPIEDFLEYTLLTTRSFHRYCPNCEKLFDEPAPMEEWKAESVSQDTAFKGSEPIRIIQTHQDIVPIVSHFAENHYDQHDHWNYQPGEKQLGYEKLLEDLNGKSARFSRFVVWGWVFVPIGIVLFFFWLIL
jgi:hypothetical protein